MRNSRGQIVRSDIPGTYHVYARTVRGAFLFGRDPLTGQDYTHRRDWILERLQLLAANFAIEVNFENLLANHLHLVLKAIPRLVKRMPAQEVARRWLRMYPGKRVLDGQWIEPAEKQVQDLAKDQKRIKQLRKRLADISWFMRTLCEYVARRANVEEGRRGRFWQGRFGCREIADEVGLLVCGLYVDLNRLRAGEIALPEDCKYSSLGLRIAALREEKPTLAGWLARFTVDRSQLEVEARPSASGLRATDHGMLEMSFARYLQLLDWIARQPRRDGKGRVLDEDEPPIVKRLGLDGQALRDTVQHFDKRFRRFVGMPESFARRAAETGGRAPHGIKAARALVCQPQG